MSLNPWLMLILGIVLGWLAAWFLSRSAPAPAEADAARRRERPTAPGDGAAEEMRPPAGAPSSAPATSAAAGAAAPPAGEWRSAAADSSDDAPGAADMLRSPAADSSDDAPVFTGTESDAESHTETAVVYEAPGEAASTETLWSASADSPDDAPAPSETLRSPAADSADDPQRSSEGWLGPGADSADDAPIYGGPAQAAVPAAAEADDPAQAALARQSAAADSPTQREAAQDDLTRIVGIGSTYAGRLRDAGIATFAQLAATDEAALGQIIAAPEWRKADYGDWIAQARRAASGDMSGLQAGG